MPLISQAQENLLNGVSQQAPVLRDPSQASEQINGLSHRAFGVVKRPGTRKLGTINTPTSARLLEINRTAGQRYIAVVTDGLVRVFDSELGVEVTVQAPDGMAYLASTDTHRDIRAVTVGDQTVISNRAKTIRQTLTKSPALLYEALVSVRQADFGTIYSVALDGTAVSYTTSIGADAADRLKISTDTIAAALIAKLATQFPTFTFVQYGSTIHIARTSGADFLLTTNDGLADAGLLAIKGSVQRFDDLPARASTGFMVEVQGDVQTQKDNYWVVYDDSKTPGKAGIWKETVAPGTLTTLDASTMPHELVFAGALVDGLDNEALPVAPTMTDYGTVDHIENYALTKDGAAIANNTPLTLHQQGDYFYANIAEANGQTAKVTAWFDVDARRIDLGTYVTVALDYYHGGVWTNLSSIILPPGTYGFNQSLSGSVVLSANDDIRLGLTYSGGVTPSIALPDKSAYVRPHANGSDAVHPGIVVTLAAGKTFTFDTTVLWPTGAQVDCTVNGLSRATYNGGQRTAAAMATLMATQLATAPGVTVTNPSAGVVNIVNVAGTECVITALGTSWHPGGGGAVASTGTFFSDDLALTTSALIGETIENISDGSSGVITANGVTTITATLSGGVTNTFVKGDLCRVVAAGVYFSFKPITWKTRACGTVEQNPFPTFTDHAVENVFAVQGRLGILSRENVILSRAGDFTDFFRTSAIDLLADDPIDVKSAGQRVAFFHSALHWNNAVILWSDQGQYLLSGDPVMTPTTVSMALLSEFPNSPAVTPVVAGRRAFFARNRSASTQVFDMDVNTVSGAPDAFEITKHVPTYLQGTPLDMVCDSAQELLFVRTDTATDTLYVFAYHYEDQDRTQASWSKWVFGGPVLGMAVVGDKLVVIVERTSNDGYLETLDLDLAHAPSSGILPLPRLDAMVTEGDVIISFNGVSTDITVPGELANTLARLVLTNPDSLADPYAALAPIGVAGNTLTFAGDLTWAQFMIGLVYDFEYDLSPFYVRYRTANGSTVETKGRTQARYVDFHYTSTSNFTVRVTPQGRSATNYPHVGVLGDGMVRIPVQSRADNVSIKVLNSTPGPCQIVRADWELFLQTRDRRV